VTKRLMVAFAASVVLLSSCLIPESFNAKADFASNGDYTFSYDGTAVHAMAAAEEKKTGSLRAKDEEGLQAEATKMKNDPMVQSVEYLGHGRYKLKLLAKKKAGENLKFRTMPVLSRNSSDYSAHTPGRLVLWTSAQR
jgi:hypothetical protein